MTKPKVICGGKEVLIDEKMSLSDVVNILLECEQPILEIQSNSAAKALVAAVIAGLVKKKVFIVVKDGENIEFTNELFKKQIREATIHILDEITETPQLKANIVKKLSQKFNVTEVRIYKKLRELAEIGLVVDNVVKGTVQLSCLGKILKQAIEKTLKKQHEVKK